MDKLPLSSRRSGSAFFGLSFCSARNRWTLLSLILSITLGAAARTAGAQANEWTWLGGSNTIDCSLPGGNCSEPGAYGMLGVPSPSNIPGGRYGAVTWTDKAGNFWLFSGDSNSTGTDGQNDLWKLNPSANQWIWVGGSNTIDHPGVYGTQGVPAAGNIPGGRWVGSSWTDKNGDFWLFGGYGSDGSGCQSFLNDLWKYSPSTNQWTWMNGSNSCDQSGSYGTTGAPAPGNTPGARDFAATWTDKNGNLWLFGGQQGYSFSDMWEYRPATNEWTWTDPHVSIDRPGTYGTLGTPGADNFPGARWAADTWTDSKGNFWLFGGLGYDINSSFGSLNDLWKFDPSTQQWTWMNGSTIIDQPGIYGVPGVYLPSNTPGGRSQGFTWTDNSGNLWLFGGNGFDSVGAVGQLNDLFEYNPSTNQWTWIYGSTTTGCAVGSPSSCGQPGLYSTLGMTAPGDIPGGRGVGADWVDTSGNFWLFGGQAVDSLGVSGNLNDVWKYQVPSSTLPAAAAPAISLVAGTYSSVQTVGITDTTPGATIFYSTSPNTNWGVYSAPITVSSTETLEAIAVAGGFSPSSVTSAAYRVQLATATALTASSYPTVVGQPVTLTAIVSVAGGESVPTGSVQFSVNGSPLGSPVTLDATSAAQYTTSALPVGRVGITAAYTPAGNASFLSSTSPVYTELVYSSPRQSGSVHFSSAVQMIGNGFSHPYGVAVDAAENVYVADAGNLSVKEILATGGYATTKTLASGFGLPAGIAVDANANLFVTDAFLSTVLELAATGGYTQVTNLGRGFELPIGVAVDANDNLYVADTGHGQVKFMALCPECGGGYGAATTLGSGFQYPWGIAVDSNKNVFITDIGNATVNELTAASNYATANTLGSGFFIDPYGLAMDTNDNLLVTDLGYGAVREISPVDGFTTVSTSGSGLSTPLGAAADAGGNLFVADTFNNAVKEISPASGNFGPRTLGIPSSIITMVFVFDKPTTLGSTAVLMQQGGAISTVFADAGTGTCMAAATYAANAACSVDVTFTPTNLSTFAGVVELLDGSGNVLALGSLQGSGVN